ncbi:DUF4118 domain-containing protein, partial [Methylogaea oryzae]|uniref:DUF4118 domain-containing protein n=1 Tax=Methylogaea oryzae TaxID=1295382 RepID=UPI000B257B69
YLWAVATIALSTLVAKTLLGHFELANLVMIYLAGVVFVASRFGRGPSILASLLGVAAFDYLFVTPYFSFTVADTQYVIVLLALLAVSIVISQLTANMRSQAKIAAHRERRASVLYAMSKELSASRSEDDIVRIAVRHIRTEFGSRNAILFPNGNGRIVYPTDAPLPESLAGCDLGVAQWVLDHDQMAGQGTDTLPGAQAVYFPLIGAEGSMGVLALLPANLRRIFLPEQRKLLETFCRQIAQAVERVRLAEQAKATFVQMEPNACATPCSAPFPTTCARPWPPSSAPPAPWRKTTTNCGRKTAAN